MLSELLDNCKASAKVYDSDNADYSCPCGIAAQVRKLYAPCHVAARTQRSGNTKFARQGRRCIFGENVQAHAHRPRQSFCCVLPVRERQPIKLLGERSPTKRTRRLRSELSRRPAERDQFICPALLVAPKFPLRLESQNSVASRRRLCKIYRRSAALPRSRWDCPLTSVATADSSR